MRTPKRKAPLTVTESANKFYWTLKSLRDPAQILLTALTSFLFSVAGAIGIGDLLKGLNWMWPVGGLASAGLLAWGVFGFFKPTYRDIAEREAGAQAELKKHRDSLQRALDEVIRQLLDYVCQTDTGTRLSAYSIEGNEFVLLSRTSPNPTLERRGRAYYALNEGDIGIAWARMFAQAEYDEVVRDDWENTLTDLGLFDKTTASNLTMHSRSIYAQRLDKGGDKVGVIVFESERPGSFTPDHLSKVQQSYLLKAITEIIWLSHLHFPRVVERRSELENGSSPNLVPEPAWKNASPIQAEPVLAPTISKLNP